MKEYGERTTVPQEDSQETILTDGSPSPVQDQKDNDATVLTGVSAVTSTAAAIMGRYREKFVKEARTIARLDHPGIVRIHDVFEENGTAYYVMDFIDGENLNDLVKREGALPEERALGYIRQVADALSYVHGHNIMHLDVKPANIIVRKSDDKAILIDFGTAKQYDSKGSQTSTTPIGLSAGYAPIEMMKVGGVQIFSPETDVYSLGATLYYLVIGQDPPDASDVLEEGLPEMPKSLSSSSRQAINSAMKTRKQRPKSVTEFIGLLNQTVEDGARRITEETAKTEAEERAKKEEAKRKQKETAEKAKEEHKSKTKKEVEDRVQKEAAMRIKREAEARQKEEEKDRQRAETKKKIRILRIWFWVSLVLTFCLVWTMFIGYIPFVAAIVSLCLLIRERIKLKRLN